MNIQCRDRFNNALVKGGDDITANVEGVDLV
jgi:hypothetical protein